jgi:hypothetical protein
MHVLAISNSRNVQARTPFVSYVKFVSLLRITDLVEMCGPSCIVIKKGESSASEEHVNFTGMISLTEVLTNGCTVFPTSRVF